MTESILDDPTTRRLVEQETPLGRVGEASDVADVIVFLASDASRYVTAMRSSSTAARRRTASRAGSVSTLQQAGSTAPTVSAWQPSRRNAVQ